MGFCWSGKKSTLTRKRWMGLRQGTFSFGVVPALQQKSHRKKPGNAGIATSMANVGQHIGKQSPGNIEGTAWYWACKACMNKTVCTKRDSARGKGADFATLIIASSRTLNWMNLTCAQYLDYVGSQAVECLSSLTFQEVQNCSWLFWARRSGKHCNIEESAGTKIVLALCLQTL